ncbi:MAG: sulfurtransferase TusA family protein [Chloroflexota bacterium]
MNDTHDNTPIADVVLDAGRTACGDLVLLIFQQMKTMDVGCVLHVVAYDRGALEDIPAWCRMTHNMLVHKVASKDSSESSHFYIQKG